MLYLLLDAMLQHFMFQNSLRDINVIPQMVYFISFYHTFTSPLLCKTEGKTNSKVSQMCEWNKNIFVKVKCQEVK